MKKKTYAIVCMLQLSILKKTHLAIDRQLWTVFEIFIFSRGLSGLSSTNADIIRVVVGRGNISELIPSPIRGSRPSRPSEIHNWHAGQLYSPFFFTLMSPETSQYAYCGFGVDWLSTLVAAYGFEHVHRVANLFFKLIFVSK